MKLQDKAMLVTLSVSCWTARKQDKKVSAEVEAAHNARDAGRYNKLLIDKTHLDPLVSYAGQIRNYHYKMTMPWMDNGARLLPSKLFTEYSAEIRKMKQEYNRLVSVLVAGYPQMVQEARRRLGTMYEPDDYPAASDLYAKFDVEIDIAPVPDGADFRVDVGDAERRRIADEISQRVAQRQESAARDAWVRVREAVGRVVTRLSAKKLIVHDSLIENLTELSALLPGMNITDDPKMDDVCKRIVDHLLVEPARLRRSTAARDKVVLHAKQILEMCPA